MPTHSAVVTPALRLESITNNFTEAELQYNYRGGIFIDLGEDSLAILPAGEQARKKISVDALTRLFLRHEQNIPLLTVVVNVAGRPPSFGDVLRSLAYQSFVQEHPGHVQVILVQDGPYGVLDNEVRSEVLNALAEFPPATLDSIQAFRLGYSREPCGRGTARNVGIWHASRKTKVIMFLDDAIVLHRDFITEQMLRHTYVSGIPMALLGFKENRTFKDITEYRSQRNTLFRDHPNFKNDWKWSKKLQDDEVIFQEVNGFDYRGQHYISGSTIHYMKITNNLNDIHGSEAIGHRWLPMFFHTGLTSVTYHSVLDVGGFDPQFDVGVWGFEDSYLGLLLSIRGVKLVPCPSAVAYKVELENEEPIQHKDLHIEYHRDTFWQRAKATEESSYNEEKLQQQMDRLWAHNLLNAVELEIPVTLPGADSVPQSAITEETEELDSGTRRRLSYPVPKLFGADTSLNSVLPVVREEEPPSLISIEGLGGLGKTTLAQKITNVLLEENIFEASAWYSVRQTDFDLHNHGIPTQLPEASLSELIFSITKQLGLRKKEVGSEIEQIEFLFSELARSRFLIVIDNIETAEDVSPLIPLLSRVDSALPSKVIITARIGIEQLPGCHPFTVPLYELDKLQSIALMRYQSRIRNLQPVMSADDYLLERIYSVVGGNPLALNLSLGLIRHTNLESVVTNLEQAEESRSDSLYQWIYWRSWNGLTEDAKLLLFIMRHFGVDGTDKLRLSAVSQLSEPRLDIAIEELANKSLLTVVGSIDKRNYAIHRLTRTFLQEIVRKWDHDLILARFKEIDSIAATANLNYTRYFLERHGL